MARLVVARSSFVAEERVRPWARDRGFDWHYTALDTPSRVAAATRGAAAVLVTADPMPRQLIEALAPSVRILARAGVGLDGIDLAAAARRGVAVLHNPDYCVDEVATHAVAMVLALNRRLLEADALVRQDWTGWQRLTPVAPLHEQTVGLIGFGRIGQATAARLTPLVAEILIHDPALVRGGVERAELLRRSDVVSLHLPLTAATRATIGAAELALMKPSAHLVNVARGALIDEAALDRALREGTLGAAALDVLTTEPPPPDHPLLRAPRLLLSPHTAWYSTGSERRLWTTTLDGISGYLSGREPEAARLAVRPD